MNLPGGLKPGRKKPVKAIPHVFLIFLTQSKTKDETAFCTKRQGVNSTEFIDKLPCI